MVELLDAARRTSARAVKSIMAATYWEVGRRVVESGQGGEKRVEYGEELLARLGEDLVSRFGRGYSRRNLQSMRQFYLSFPANQIWQTVSAKSSPFALADLARAFPLPWSYYAQLIGYSRSPEAFAFYQAEALRGGWSVRQLRRQMNSQFYERTALSKTKQKCFEMRPLPA